MRAYSLIAPAKINLYLEIIGDRPDGYHELAMILQSVALSDRVDLRANGTDRIRVFCDNPQVPIDESNLAYRAADLMAQQFPKLFEKLGGVDIMLEKKIPMGAGLAGGSANAAAVLVGLDLMWNLGLTHSELQALAARLGSDIPFCISGGTAIATGRGEQLAPLPSPDHLHVVLAKYRSIAVATPWAYKAYRQQFGSSYISDPAEQTGRRQQMHSGEMVGAIGQRDSKRIGQLLHNDLEKVVLPAYPKVAQLRQALEQMETLGVMMSGSGSTVFALVETQAQAKQVYQRLSAAIPDNDLSIWTTHLTAGGIQVSP
ncbi:MAG: 4-(cytidine 5'-diphospho)-2-C-methyl-D-erythritol kinase [Drouetiella hepatica Uher 2000/2452]|jgi:4-diphosphocytidyl-2-C-methyl-D-erythritol kinase|uniref:4-diphosphocytidyl-2-C-methyl-D-erythritol kinase n=1 Tax=Drouetiella hepatica Uher 2000/2452 TaxID=904376 RepID=A0A951QCJ3_9CYAN|nr:4-(cytidine 5'-diphospho)-2-C-methyl-D-erythritol kinase [Drouetiella hepatica Uher 2000/2452]